MSLLLLYPGERLPSFFWVSKSSPSFKGQLRCFFFHEAFTDPFRLWSPFTSPLRCRALSALSGMAQASPFLTSFTWLSCWRQGPWLGFPLNSLLPGWDRNATFLRVQLWFLVFDLYPRNCMSAMKLPPSLTAEYMVDSQDGPGACCLLPMSRPHSH